MGQYFFLALLRLFITYNLTLNGEGKIIPALETKPRKVFPSGKNFSALSGRGLGLTTCRFLNNDAQNR